MDEDHSKMYHVVDPRSVKVRKEAQWFINGVSPMIDNYCSFLLLTTVEDHCDN